MKVARGTCVLLVVAMAVVAAGCSGGGSASSASTITKTTASQVKAGKRAKPVEVPASASFAEFADMAVPSVGEAVHGDLLRYQSIPPADSDLASKIRRFRIAYASTTETGAPTIVTGMASVPVRTTPAGGWKLATHAHGSTGLADDCAPSARPDDDASAEERFVQSVGAAHGYVVASTDYEGQGGPGRHPFLVGRSEGRSMLDAALAVRGLPGVEVIADEAAIVGFSQGGHAALWANQIAAEYTPELTITGTVAGAPASELEELSTGADTLAGPELVMMLGGMAAANPHLDLASVLTDNGMRLLETFDRSCGAQPDPGWEDEALFRVDPLRTEPWIGIIRANTPGSLRGESPVLIVHGETDTQVPVDQSVDLLERMCKAGAVVERRVVAGAGHIEAAIPAYQQGFDWLDGLAAGRPPVNDCRR